MTLTLLGGSNGYQGTRLLFLWSSEHKACCIEALKKTILFHALLKSLEFCN